MAQRTDKNRQLATDNRQHPSCSDGSSPRLIVGLADPGTKVRLIVGLGNPGREYHGTRHNIGFAVLDALAESHGLHFSFESKWNAEVAKIPAVSSADSDLLLMKPMTFMNLSGTAVASYARFFQLAASQTLVVLDDVALPLGKLRFKAGGSAGGQRGLESILTHFSTQEVPRLRIGVSPLQEEEQAFAKPLSQFVLSRFSTAELTQVEVSIKRATEALEYLFQEGLDRTMNFYNADPSSKAS
ncbi:MAG: aminoacyl-tRNA hydrolase [Chthoniobacterales bacterium]